MAKAQKKPSILDINFTTVGNDAEIIRKIVDRGWSLDWLRKSYAQRMDMQMDVTAVHCNGNPLRLEALLAADDFNFAHDMSGICRHIDRDTGKLTGFFSPRFSQPETKTRLGAAMLAASPAPPDLLGEAVKVMEEWMPELDERERFIEAQDSAHTSKQIEMLERIYRTRAFIAKAKETNMTTRDDGGPAFPLAVAVGPSDDTYCSADVSGGTGLTKREYAAIKALQGLLAYRGSSSLNAADAVSQADTLLAELAKDTP